MTSKLPPGVRRLFRLPWSRSGALRDVDDEMRFHLEMRVAALEAQGMTPAQAEAEALRRFGDVHDLRARSMQVATRRARKERLLEKFATSIRAVRFALRRLRSSPMFTIAATLTLAVAIGATASVFGVVDGVLLKSFPYRDPDRVLTIWQSNSERHQLQVGMAPANYFDFQAQNKAFTALAASGNEFPFMVTRAHDAESVTGIAVTPSYFAVLGITPVLGRPLAADSNGPPEVMISYGYWQRRFGGAPSVIGQTLVLDNPSDPSPTPRHRYTIVGVTPPGLPGAAELWTRTIFDPDNANMRDVHYLLVYGRLRPGVSVKSGESDLETVAGRLAVAYPQANAHWSIRTVSLVDQLLGPVRPALVMLLSAAACVLLIGAANLANLFLVRCLARQREMALRTALGATRNRLISDLVIEAALLSLMAGTLGIALAVGGVRALRALAPPTLPRLSQIGVDGRVVAFCALVSIATVFVFGLLPAWQASRGNLADFLKDGGRGTGSAQHHRLQDGLVVLQVTVALVLLTGAGLLVETFIRFEQIDPGFRADHLLTARVALPNARYPTAERQAALLMRLPEYLETQPGVEAASVSGWLPGRGDRGLQPFAIVGDPTPDPAHAPAALLVSISPDYFRTMGIKVLRGRGVLRSDDQRAVKITVVDELLAKRFFGSRDPLGQRLSLIYGDTAEIVGVVATVKQNGLAAEDRPEYYLPYPQMVKYVNGFFGSYAALRMSGDPLAETRALKQAVADLDPMVPVSDIRTMSDRMVESVGTTRFSTFLASLFAVIALVLGIVGIYSVLAYIVSQRQREIAVRIALGARHTHVMGDVMRRALALAGAGIVLGSGAAWTLTRLLAGLFIGVSPHDPAIFGGAAAAFGLVALMAAVVPAFRTTRVNPIVALTST